MTRYRVSWASSAILCASVAILPLGFSEVVQSAEPSTTAPSALTGCTAVDADGAWWNEDFPETSGRFRVELDATPSADGLDAVVGVSDGEAGGFTALAAIARF